MNLHDVEKAIADENLIHYNLFEQHAPRDNEVGIRRTPEGLLVFLNDERAVPLGERLFADDDSAAYAAFLDRVRLINSTYRRRDAELRAERE